VAAAVNVLQRAGLERVMQSPSLRRVVKRFLLPRAAGPCTREIVSGLGKGLKLRVLPETPAAYWLGTHEPVTQDLLRRRIRPGMVVYDCGANIGYFSLILARLVGPSGRVFAFEPSPGSLECLRATPGLNGLSHLAVIPQAVWERVETLHFAQTQPGRSLVSDHVEGASAFGKSGAQRIIEVPAVALDDFVYGQGNPPPDFVKVDVEGAEGKALAGARRLLSERRPELLLEIHGEPGREVHSLLKELKYVSTNVLTGEVPETADAFAAWMQHYLSVPA
jgi:FkbM family methyltransferase